MKIKIVRSCSHYGNNLYHYSDKENREHQNPYNSIKPYCGGW